MGNIENYKILGKDLAISIILTLILLFVLSDYHISDILHMPVLL